MICCNCRKAGTFNTLAEWVADREARDVLRQLADRRHALCSGGTWCDCEHVTGPGWLVPERGRQDETRGEGSTSDELAG